MAHILTSAIRVQRWELGFDDNQRRLDFPRAEVERFEGQAGKVKYIAGDLQFDGLRALLDRGQWAATSLSAGGVVLRDEDGTFELSIGRIEFPRGMMVARAVEAGMELVTPHASLNDVSLTVKSPMEGPVRDRAAQAAQAAQKALAAGKPPEAAAPERLRQEKLRFLDGVKGEIKLTIRIKLDLPVLGSRTLDQALHIPIQDGSLDFRALDKSLDWLEGTFLDIGLDGERLAVKYGVPIVLPSREIISWTLDRDALTLAKFDRVPLRSLADFRFAGRAKDKDRRSRLESFAMEGLTISLSLLVPRSLEVGGGAIMFGGDDAPGIVDLKIGGNLRSKGPGALGGSIALLDTTIKDLRLGGTTMTVDRLHLGSIEQAEVTFDGFRPTQVTARIDRVTATNLSLLLGRRGS